MFHNISNPKWFGNWSRLEDDYLGNGGTDIADNFTFSKMEKTGGLFGSIIRLATAFPACDPETGHATGEPPREVTLLPDKNGSTLKPLQALVGGNIETFDIAFGEGVSLYVNEEGLFTCPPNRAIFATEEMAKAGYLSQLDYSKVVEMGDFYTVLNGDIVAVGFDPETGESRSLTDGETARVEGYFTVISRPGSGAKAVDDIRHGITPDSYDISVESHDCTSGRNALAADAPARDAPGKDDQNIG